MQNIRKVLSFIFILNIITCLMGCSVSMDSYNYEAALMEYNKGNYTEAKTLIKQVVEKNNKAEYLILAGHICVELGDTKEAINYFNKAIKNSDNIIDLENNKEATRGIGLAYAYADDYANAIKQYDAALKIEVDEELNKYIIKNKIEALSKNKEEKAAIALADSYIKEYKEDDSIIVLKGRCYAMLNDENNMLNCINAIINKGNNNAYYELAKCYELLGNYDKAYSSYENFYKNGKGVDKELISLSMVNCLINQENYDKAMQVLNEKIGSKNKTYKKEYKKYCIVILEKQGNYADAYNKAKEYVIEYPDDKAMAKEVAFLETRINN